ncbi:MAG: adenylate/guanylate cyclase domain-containing protein [Bacteroidota bacterium]
MDFYTKRKVKVIRDYCVSWTIAFALFALIRGLGTVEQGSLRLDLNSSIKIILTLGPVMGVFSGLAQIWMEENFYRRVSILRFLLLRMLYTLFIVFFLIISAFVIYSFFFVENLNLKSFVFQEGSFSVYIYVICIDLLINSFRQLNLMLGNGNIAKLITGKFYHPREEERIFMFLDLQSSTHLAEKLGHQLYSSLIQDCFYDLGVVIKDNAEIYQYVGDEAVLTWRLDIGIQYENFLNAFFNFKNQLDLKKMYYKEKYGTIPFFKAGMHAGKVMVTEIGKHKREIAYHGDVLNTAARIQGQCNELGAELLISESLKNYIKSEKHHLINAGSTLLRGKQKEMVIYSVKK